MACSSLASTSEVKLTPDTLSFPVQTEPEPSETRELGTDKYGLVAPGDRGPCGSTGFLGLIRTRGSTIARVITIVAMPPIMLHLMIFFFFAAAASSSLNLMLAPAPPVPELSSGCP